MVKHKCHRRLSTNRRRVAVWRCLWVLLSAGALLFIRTGRAQEPAAGHSMADLRRIIGAAVNGKEAEVVIPPGVYRGGPEAENRCVITIRRAENLHIRAEGVTMLCTRLARALEIDHCKNLTISGLTINYDPLPFTQGDIVKVAADGGWVDVKIHAGYPVKAYSRIDIVDRSTRMRKRGMPFLWGAKAEVTGTDTVRVAQPALGKIAVAGDLASMSTGPDSGLDCHGVVIDNSDGTTLENFMVNSAPGMGVIESGGEGNAHFNGVKIIPGPRPPGATERPILSTSWDAIQNKTCRRGPVVENCVIEDAGDDSWSVQNTDYLVVRAEGSSMTVIPRDPYGGELQPGDRLRQSLDSGEAAIRRVVKRGDRTQAGLAPEVLEKLEGAANYSLWKVGPVCLELELDRSVPFIVGESLYSPDRSGEGFVFRNNTVHSSGRILIKAGNGVVAGNTLSDLHGIMVCPELPEGAAAGISQLVIRNNTLIAPGHRCEGTWTTQAGAIAVSADENDPQHRGRKQFCPAGMFADIVIENNLIQDANGVAVLVGSARNVVVRNNRTTGSHQTRPLRFGAEAGVDQGCAFYFARCDGVRFENNRIEHPGPFLKRGLVAGVGVTHLALAGKLDFNDVP